MDNVTRSGPVVVGVDGSDAGWSALRWSARLAARQHLPIRAVHAAWVGPSPYPIFGDHMRQMIDATIGYGREVLSRAEQELAAHAPALTMTSTLLDSPPVPGLIRQSEQASLMVIGATGTGRVVGLLAGSVALDLPPRSHCPVIVVRGDDPIGPPDGRAPTADNVTTPREVRPVVVGVAGSQLDHPAIEFAVEQASFRRAPLVALHAVSDTLLPPMDQLAGFRTRWAEVEQLEHRRLSGYLAGWSSRFPDVEVTAVIAYDQPAAALLELSARAQLAVVGTRGRGQLAGVLLGSVSRTMIQRSSCPVAVVRTDA